MDKMEQKDQKGQCENNVLNKNVLASTHINFLFGSGVNGSLLPQLKGFTKTIEKLKEFGAINVEDFEAAIDYLDDDSKRENIKCTFIEEFNEFHDRALYNDNLLLNSSANNLEKLLVKTYTIVQETQNRNPSMKQINIYTLNYDSVVEKLLSNNGYLFNSISASNSESKAKLIDVIGYNYTLNKYIPTYMVSKLHGDISKPIIPGKIKYKDILNDEYFEVVFNMKEQLSKPNSILIVIGYSGNDKHINKILTDCMNGGLTLYWYKYSKDDKIPVAGRTNVFVREQDDYANIKDTTQVCFEDMEYVWATK